MAKTNSGSKIAMRKLDAMPLQAAISALPGRAMLESLARLRWKKAERLRGWKICCRYRHVQEVQAICTSAVLFLISTATSKIWNLDLA